MQAVVLAGGKGTRLAERLQGRPKPLIDVDGVPLLERQIKTLRTFGVDDAVVLVNHAADQIARHCIEQSNFGLARLRLIDDGEPRGTAGAVLACLEELADRFLVIYGDTLFNIDIDRIVSAHVHSGADATLFLHPNDHPFDSDLVSLDEQGAIAAFHPKPHKAGAWLPNLVNAAFYVMERAALAPWRDVPTPCDFGSDLFPSMLRAGGRLAGYTSFEYIKDIGTPTRLDKAVAHLRAGVVSRATLAHDQPCVFLDRDGTLNVLRDYVRRPDDLELIAGAAEAVRRLNDAEYRVAIVTNQPVLARGECTVADLREIHAKLDMKLAEVGAFADRVYYCPHHPDRGFRGEVAALKVDCACRKPKPGLILKGARDLNADLKRSWMIGDSTADVLAAKRAGVRSVLVRTGEGGRDGKNAVGADFEADDVLDAVCFIVDVYPRLVRTAVAFTASVAAGDLVLIGGAARVGKSTLARIATHEIARRGLSCQMVSIDRWLRSEAERGPGVLGRYDWQAMLEDLAPWLQGGQCEVTPPYYDRVRRERVTHKSPEACDMPLTPESVLVLEGVPALLLTLKTSRSIHRIHVGANERRRRARVSADLVHRGLPDPAMADAIVAARLVDETNHVERAAASADLTLVLDASFASQSEAVAT